MSALDPRRELVDRAAEVRSKLLARFEDLPHGIPLSPVQTEVLSSVLSGMSKSLEEAGKCLLKEIEDGRRDCAYRDCEAALASVERAARVVESVIDQRTDTRIVAGLQFADRACLDGFATVTLGTSALSPRPPIVVIEPRDGPAMTPPNTQLIVPSLIRLDRETIDVPVPFVYMPRSYVGAPWMLPTLQHEVGHHADHLSGASAALRTSLQLDAADDDNAVIRLEQWKLWMREIVADVWGIVLGGADFAWALALILDGRGVNQFSVTSTDYPPASIRIAILAHTLRLLKLEKWAPRLEELLVAKTIVGDTKARHPRYHGDVPRVVGAILDAGSIHTDGITAEAQDGIIDEIAAAILDGGEPKLPADARVRHLASAARRALDRKPAAAERIVQRAFSFSEKIEMQPWVVSQDTLKFLGEAEYFRPTTVDAPNGTWKSPPVRLLEKHDSVAFLGATHHQLLDSLREAQAARAKKPYTRLEFFFLNDDRLEWLATPAISGAQLRERRDVARKALADYLLRDNPACAASWAFYCYDRPHFFASYWDWDKPNGRIHVSPYVWGMDVGDCPGIDFIRGTDPPQRYLAYVDGLAALRNTPGTERIAGSPT